MSVSRTARYCRCGARLAQDNPRSLCDPCRRRSLNTLVSAPEVPPSFWDTEELRDALSARHMGRVVHAYRRNPWHRQPLPQRVVAGWVGLMQTQLSRIENGAPTQDLAKLIQWARVLRIPTALLWFDVPGASQPDRHAAPESAEAAQQARPVDAMNRRELLRLISMTGALLAVPGLDEQVDLERLEHAAAIGRTDLAAAAEHERLNTQLWQVFSRTTSKQTTLPAVRTQLGILKTALQHPQTSAVRHKLCTATADLFQLSGEIFFDGDQYTDAAQCYALAVSAAKEANAYDLLACAMTRHAFIGVYERQFEQAAPLLAGAATVALRGNSRLSTRHWVAAVQAQAHAGLGDLAACERALAKAEDVANLDGPVHTGGWLRFEGSRLAEERGACYVELGRPDLAEATLTNALYRDLSPRRRGSVLTDLATIGAQRRDTHQLVTYGNAALDVARQTGSAGYVGRKLAALRPQLAPFRADTHVRHLEQEISRLKTVPV
ncbi:transcriptional regulator [Amycolatopsis sp. NPDC098790]|uniref:transcriptional regulator n=1 Tax=Amycolatopsis sp. NPDC098790 TaxID=3363939 RepID=UPI0038152D35